MLKSNNGEIHIQGTKLDLMAEFSQLVERLVNQHVFDEDDIQMCLEMAKKSDDEKKAEIEKFENTLGKEALDFITHLFD